MKRAADEVLKDALDLPVEARAALVDSLLDSLDTAVDPDAEALWQAEILRRAREIDEGSAQMVPWNELRARLVRATDDK